MSATIRAEQTGDEEAIDSVIADAFDEMDEANIVRLMRANYPGFEPRYSLCAWDRSRQLVGHALFTPARIRLMGQTISAVAVGPVAVVSAKQRKGVGAKLMRRGLEIAQRDGHEIAFLYGHPTYYPRFGFRSCFGMAKVTIDVSRLPAPKMALRQTKVTPADVAWLAERHAAEWAEVDFAWLWGQTLSEWTLPHVNAIMWRMPDGERAGYTVAPPGRQKCTLLLAEKPELAREILATIRPDNLRHHPAGWLAKHAMDPAWATAEAMQNPAAQACELKPGTLEPYIVALHARQRPPGYAMFPLAFMAG